MEGNEASELGHQPDGLPVVSSTKGNDEQEDIQKLTRMRRSTSKILRNLDMGEKHL